MLRKKEYKYGLTLGASQNESDGKCLAINMINKNGINEKRNGHTNIKEFLDIELNPLKINGIYSYSYTDENGSRGKSTIVHAGDKLFRCNDDFSEKSEIPVLGGITILDEKSQAIMLGNDLFIAGCGGLLLYDGEKIKNAYENDLSYVPLTSYGITDQSNGAHRIKGEGENLFTRKRKIKLRGSNHFRENNMPNLFLLDGNIKYGSTFKMEVKIRTRTSEEEITDNTTSYIGIDKESGEEVSKIVTIRFEKPLVSAKNAFFVSEPIRDEDGNIVNLKFNDKIYTYDTLPFGVSVKNKNELRLSFEAVAPFIGQDNITVEYEVEGTPEMMKKASLLSLSNAENGKELLLVNFGDNKIYFSDKQNGIFHMPIENQISLGSDGEPITAIVRLSDNLIGAFKKNSFYRVRFTSSNDKGYEIFLSSDSVGAYSQASSCVVSYDCLVFNQDGVFGVSDYKSTGNIFDVLRSRSSKINSFLKSHTSKERENAVSLSSNKRYYLFVGDNAYIADTRYKVKGEGSDSFGYEWWIWNGITARTVYKDGESIYFGTDNGEIRKLTDEYLDIEKAEYKTSENSLLCNQGEKHTEFILSECPEIYENTTAFLNKHERFLSQGAETSGKTLTINPSDLIFKDGTPKIGEGSYLGLHRDGVRLANVRILDIDFFTGKATIDISLSKKEYDVYIHELSGREYDIKKNEDTYTLFENGEPIKIAEIENASLTLNQRKSVECVYETVPLSFDLPTKRKTLKSIILKIPKWASGKIEVEIRTKETVQKREITLGKSLDFNSFDFESISFNRELDMLVPIRFFIRSFDYLVLKITSRDSSPFGVDAVFFEYIIQD